MLAIVILSLLLSHTLTTAKNVNLVTEQTEIRADYPKLTNSFKPWETTIDEKDLSNFYLSPAELSMFALCIFFGGLSVLLVYFEFIKPIKKRKKYLIMQNSLDSNASGKLNEGTKTTLNLDQSTPKAEEVNVTKGVPLTSGKGQVNEGNTDW
eukprot:GAHX01000895.1.p1 GENE.GAHX01000895.1~~GAHX01000895.1.p1  ORF type:complete len:152 (-),score=25.27 GAHX01000895.1:33-488(-)